MTLQDLILEARKLTISDQIQLITALLNTLGQHFTLSPSPAQPTPALTPETELGWSPDFFECTAGAWHGDAVERAEQGQPHQREWQLL